MIRLNHPLLRLEITNRESHLELLLAIFTGGSLLLNVFFVLFANVVIQIRNLIKRLP